MQPHNGNNSPWKRGDLSRLFRIRRKNNFRKNLMQFISRICTVVILTIIFIGCENNYDSGLKLLGENKLNEAIQSFEKVGTKDRNYYNALSKINYIYGILNYNDSNFNEAMKYLELVTDIDEYKVRAKNLMIFISATQLKNDNRDSSIILFNSIPTSSELYNKARQEIDQIISDKFNLEEHNNYLKAIKEYKQGNSEKALLMLKNISNRSNSYEVAQNMIKNLEELNELTSHTTIVEVNCEWLPLLGTYDLFINGKKYDTNIDNKNKANSLYNNIFLARIPAVVMADDGSFDFGDEKVGVCKKRIDWDSPFGTKSIHGEIINTFYLDFQNVLSLNDTALIAKIKHDKSKLIFLFFLYKIKDVEYVDVNKWEQNVYFKIDLLKYCIFNIDYIFYKSKN